MSYDFSIDKKAGIIVLTVCGLISVLFLVAGFLIGIQYQFSLKPLNLIVRSSSPKAAKASVKIPTAKPATQTADAAPVPGKPVSPTMPAVALDQQSSADTTPKAEAKAASTTATNQTITSPSEAAGQSPATSPGAGTQRSAPQAAARTTLSPAAAPATSAQDFPSQERKYSIQIGAFLNPANAARLVKDLQHEGYNAKEFIATDSEYRVWHTVRIGPFNNIEAASHEARSFRQSAHLLALVRPAGSL